MIKYYSTEPAGYTLEVSSHFQPDLVRFTIEDTSVILNIEQLEHLNKCLNNFMDAYHKRSLVYPVVYVDGDTI